MEKYEHLFGIDPIGAFKKIEEDYKRYFEAAFKIEKTSEYNALARLDNERIKLLDEDGNMSKEPYLELLPEYNPATGLGNIDDLASLFEDGFGGRDVARSFFTDFISKGLMRGLMEKFIPYGHQIGMMKKAFAGKDDNGSPLKYKNTVITSGTGSGKTESFLLPLLADIFKEAQEWPEAVDHKDWFLPVDGLYSPCQREGDARTAAVRALVLYPMNALVEDQMARLREALDSNEVRTFMDSDNGLKGNRIYFGSYNGSTISQKSYGLYEEYASRGDGERRTFIEKRRDVAGRLSKIHEDFDDICQYVRNDPDKKDALYISPRLGGERVTSEMITRWDMQVTPPDIMITNTSMLSIMLMRKAEESIFEKTRSWLAAEDVPDGELREKAKKDRVFHIVVDELHLYRGTAGSEVACLLRMLFNALGLGPVVGGKPNPQIRILASSASLGDEDATERFMQEFFGIYSADGEKVFNIQKGDNYYGEDKDYTIDYTKFAAFTPENFVDLDAGIKPEETDKSEEIHNQRVGMMNDFVKEQFSRDNVVRFVEDYQEQIFWDFYHELPENTDLSRKPIAQSKLLEKLFKGNEDALRGFFIFRGYIDEIDSLKKKHKLPRFRFHKFFKYIEGLWGELKPSISGDIDPISSLSYTAEEVGPNNRKVLELLRCENCGQLFIGGNRKQDENDKDNPTLTLNYPSLDQIPNFNPTPMVQNKSYKDYAIFWPHDINDKPELDHANGIVSSAEDHVVRISDGDKKLENGIATWVPGFLDATSGKFEKRKALPGGAINTNPNGIQGFLYKVVVDKDSDDEIDEIQKTKIFAAPCTCPHCHQNYTNRKYTTSPIRSFRTGIDRSNQILSKELLYQLDKKSAKLIGFSDSREDAAKQALGIEKEQYRDMVRMLFVECVNEIDTIVDKIRDFIVEYKRTNPDVDPEDLCEIVENEFKQNDSKAIADAILFGKKKILAKYKEVTIPLSDLIGSSFAGTLVRKLLENGINPAGEAFKYQWYRRKFGKEMYHWSEAYDFNRAVITENNFAETGTSTSYKTQIELQLQNAVFANSFGKYMGVSVLDAGIGYICCTRSKKISDSDEYKKLESILPKDIVVYDFVDAFIRILGDNYYYPSNEDSDRPKEYKDLKVAVKRHIRTFVGCDVNKADDPKEKELGDTLIDFLKKHCTYQDSIILDLDKLSFRKMNDDEYLKCPKCGRVHPNIGSGFCTNCRKELDNNNRVKTAELYRHYISFDILKEKKKPRRLHTEELSGQTDDIQTRLREFKDLILENNEGYRKTKPIDMVCVTTTMEVGVDIGSLQAIFQGNMPPTRYNYQQRVGRGGRRGQAYSTAFTFCRGRSHDVYYYKKATDEMVGGIPATPKLSLAPYNETAADGTNYKRMKLAIMKRVVVKELLHLAFIKLPYNYELVDTAGEFGTIGEWKNGTTKDKLKQWISKNEDDIIETMVDRYFAQFNQDGCIKDDKDSLIQWIKNENGMVGQMDNAISKTSVVSKGLAQYLTETGFLPMYGMPSDSRNFYHGFDYEHNKVRSIDRSSEMAISEFAPGAEKTKDKGKYRVESITLPIKEEASNYRGLSFFDPNGDALADRYIITYSEKIDGSSQNNEIKDIDEAPHNISVDELKPSLNERQRLIVIPQAYRSLDIIGNTGTPVENNDKGSSFVQCQLFARDNSTSIPTKTIKDRQGQKLNVDITLYELGFNEDPTIWHVNSNNGQFYTGSYKERVSDPHGGNTNFSFFKMNNGEVERIVVNKDSHDIALGSKKVTEMIKLELKCYPDTLNLSLDKGNRSAIRAAFYSAAFLLQRALADKLDVQPEEIEIVEKIDSQHEYPVIYLSDALANGAGIVGYLYEDNHLFDLIKTIIDFNAFDKGKTPKDQCFMQSLIAHRNKCLTACQECLLAYNNRGFHHVLDWRMGVGILRLMIDSSYDFGFNAENRGKYEELKDYDGSIVKACATKLRFEDTTKSIGKVGNTIKGIYHPLWSLEKVKDKYKEDGDNIEWYNTFKLLRSDLTKDEDGTPSQKPVLGTKKKARKKETNDDTNDPKQKRSNTNQGQTEDEEIIEL